jgi:hypothetical protein
MVRRLRIEDLLKKLNDDAAKVIDFKENPNLYKPDKELYLAKIKEIADIQTTGFESGLLKLKFAMAEHLNFDNIVR